MLLICVSMSAIIKNSMYDKSFDHRPLRSFKLGILDEDIEIALCKIGGPIILFVFVPLYLIIISSMIYKDFSEGMSYPIKTHLLNFVVPILNAWFGVWLCRKGYGWFGGNKS